MGETRKGKKYYKVLAFILVLAFLVGQLPNALNQLKVSGATTNEVQTTNESEDATTFTWDNATVYFLLTDRFNNGNTSNDHSYGRGMDQNGNVVQGVNQSATFHGGDFAGITEKIEEGYFDDLGVNALWVSAPYEQIHGYLVGSDAANSFPHYGYHGYYALDFTQTDANYGTENEFRELVDTAHEHGIRIVLDIVMNHAGYNTILDMANYNFGTLKSGWESSYYSHQNINNSTYHGYIDYTSSSADWASWWGANWLRAGIAGYPEPGGTSQTMCVSNLPDFRTESNTVVSIPTFLQNKWRSEGRYNDEMNGLNSYLSSHGKSMTVTNCLTYWLQSWVREFGVDGFRCDTAKHVECASWKTLKDACVEALRDWKNNNPEKALDDLDFWMTGEVWDHGVYKDEYYTQGGFDSIINFTTQGGGLLSTSNVTGTYEFLAETINTDPEFNVLSYISSHDSVLARGDLIYKGSSLLLAPGAVQIFYGDESNRPVDNTADANGQHNLRCDMNWDSMDEETLAHWQKVGTFRNNHVSVGAGANTTLTASSGVAFGRTYSKNGVTDRVAFCIGAANNTNVTIDVSDIWNDGQVVINAYDSSSYTVTDGVITCSSGKNGTILLQEPDGKPLVSVTGNPKFKGTQTVTIHIAEADYAKVSVDGAKKFIAHDGDTFTIGENAYEGDTIKVYVWATNEIGARTSVFTFYKAYESENLEEIEYDGILYVKSYNGTAPYVYAWDSNKTALKGAWPGTPMTEMNDEGYYVMDMGTKGAYNVVLNNGSSTQSGDITNLKGKVWVDITSSSFDNEIVKREVGEETTPVTIHVKPYGSQVPYLYVWDNNGATYNGGFPGKLMTTMSNGWYTFTANTSTALNCIVSGGSNQNQSDNITGIVNEVYITANAADYSDLDVEFVGVEESNLSILKTETKEIKNMSPEDYTVATYTALVNLVPAADALIAQGEEVDEEDVLDMIVQIRSAKADLVVSSPTLEGMMVGSTFVSGTAAYGSTVHITEGSHVYETIADDVTGQWSTNIEALSLTSYLAVYATLGERISMTTYYSVDPYHTATPTPTIYVETTPPITPTITPTDTPTDTPTITPTQAADTMTVYYYSTDATTNIHYKVGSGGWTTVPGVEMSSTSIGRYRCSAIDMNGQSTLTCCFNNGSGTWDNNGGNNYVLSFDESETYTIINGIVTKGSPSNTENDVVTLYYYSGWNSAYIHYCLSNGAWTTVPGVVMSSSEYSNYWKITIDLDSASYIRFCLNNGNGSWDNKGGSDYYIYAPGSYTLKNGVVSSGTPQS